MSALQQRLSALRLGAVRPGPAAALEPTAAAGPVPRFQDLGWIAPLSLTSAGGVALVSVANALSRTGRPGGHLLFWLGLLAIVLPIVLRLASAAPRRSERFVLLLVLTTATYLVKLLRDPFGFTYADELVHQHNLMTMLDTGALFGDNPILSVTPSYPGLESVAAAIASTTGLSPLASGVILIGAARVILMLGLLLLYEHVAGSVRIASVAAALYAISPHFLFFTAQFSYESLALPLAVLVVVAAVRRDHPPDRRGRLTLAIVLIGAVVVTHHMTSYALVAVLLAICLVPLPWQRIRPPRPWAIAAMAVVATAAWLTLVASRTVGYLSPVLTGAIDDTFQTAAGESTTRKLFTSSSGSTAPFWEHWIVIGSTLLLSLAVFGGLLVLWRRHRDAPTAVVMGCASVAYLGTLPLRLVPKAWETAVRASEFLFVGVALVIGLVAVELVERVRPRAWSLTALAVAAGVLLVGGVLSASSRSGRVAEPFRVVSAGAQLDPDSVAVAKWMRRVLGPGERVAAQAADGRLLLTYGRQRVYVTSDPAFDSVVKTEVLYPWQVDLLRRHKVRFVVVNARRTSESVTAGYYFPRKRVTGDDRFPRATLTKFERGGAHRIYSSGDVVVDELPRVLRSSAGRAASR